jgi:ABC-type proline/glycine betaine transport system permease subunit
VSKDRITIFVTFRSRMCFPFTLINRMKTLPTIALVSALVAFALLPVTPAIASSALFLATLAPIVLADYTRVRPVANALAQVVASSRRRERLGLAA